MSVYFDASVLVALFSNESFSPRADRAFRGRGIVSIVSDFGAAEFATAISRKMRMGLLTRPEARRAFSEFDDWIARMAARIEATPTDIRVAEAALRRLDLTLRAPDALNIAVVQRVGAELATFDERMANCARALGIAVARI